jgi:hypothetical protein
MQVEINEDGSTWVEIRAGRKRYFGPKHAVSIAVRGNSLKLDELINPIDRDHTKRVVYRDADGKYGVPPDPNVIPEGCERIEINSLAEEDRIAGEMRRDIERDFADDREMTRQLDRAFADKNGKTPREIIASSGAYKTDFGREMCHAMLESLDAEERNREKVNVNFFFHTREYDR